MALKLAERIVAAPEYLDRKQATRRDERGHFKLTANMLKHMEPITRNAPIRMLGNSHSDADHTFGNELFTGATVIASEKCCGRNAR